MENCGFLISHICMSRFFIIIITYYKNENSSYLSTFPGDINTQCVWWNILSYYENIKSKLKIEK